MHIFDYKNVEDRAPDPKVVKLVTDDAKLLTDDVNAGVVYGAIVSGPTEA